MMVAIIVLSLTRGITRDFCLSSSIAIRQNGLFSEPSQTGSIHISGMTILETIAHSLPLAFSSLCCFYAFLALGTFSMQLMGMIECVFCIPEALLWDCFSFNYSLNSKNQRSQPQPLHFIWTAHFHTHSTFYFVYIYITYTHITDVNFLNVWLPCLSHFCNCTRQMFLPFSSFPLT